MIPDEPRHQRGAGQVVVGNISKAQSTQEVSDQLLCACLRLRHDPTAIDAVRQAARAIDNWEAVLARMGGERVTPLIHRTVRGLDVLPAPIEQAAQQGYRFTSLRNLVLLHALVECTEKLTASQVPAIVLKGAALAEIIYGNIALRPMGDVDLLVHPQHVATVRSILEGLGYTQDRAETHPGVLTEHENELSFSRVGRTSANMDIHWSLFDSPYYQSRIAMDWFWETARPVHIAKTPTLMLGPEAQVIHLCGHLGLHHQAEGLLWWHDIAEVLVHYRDELDWDVLLARTRAFNLVLPVRTVLTRLVEVWHAPVPGSVLAALQDHEVSAEEDRVFAGLSASERPAGKRFWTDVSTMPGWRQRLRFARTNLFPSVAYMRQRYRIAHPLLLPFYYPYRWFRGLRDLSEKA
jgi:hypothetical protein